MVEKAKIRILFVDDEPNILKGFKRSLRPLRSLWDMTFAPGGKQALAILEQRPFDVVLSDMRMPEMDGSQLLEIVRRTYPGIMRIILSGHSDEDLIMKSVKSAHQFLSKPCEKQTLISAVSRAGYLNNILQPSGLKDRLGGIECIPSLPSLYGEMMSDMDCGSESADSVGRIIEQDMGMTAKVLQLVNSSFFGIHRHRSRVREAVAFLGIDIMKHLALDMNVFSRFNRALPIVGVDEIHDHCIRTAGIAKQIAGGGKMNVKTADNAVICAFLHDIGRLLMAEYFSDQYERAIRLAGQEQMTVPEAEQAVFNVTHAEIGSYLLGLWGLPDMIVEGIAFHHSPARAAPQNMKLAGLIHTADLIEHHVSQGESLDRCMDKIDPVFRQKQGMSEKVAQWLAIADNRVGN